MTPTCGHIYGRGDGCPRPATHVRSGGGYRCEAHKGFGKPIPPDDLDSLPGMDATTAPSGTGAKGRKCVRHTWGLDGNRGATCVRCGHGRDDAKARRGKSARRRGNDMERAVAAALRGKRTGQYGTLVDVEAGPFDIQVKTGQRFPGWIWDIIDGMPVSMTRQRVLAAFDSPGPGVKRRGLVCYLWEDWADEHGAER